MEPICSLQQVSKDFILPHGQTLHVLEGIDLTICPKEVVAIVGPSGCGKSTVLRIMAGLIPPTSGQLLYLGKEHDSILPSMSMVFQNFALYPWMTVKQNVEMGLKAERIPQCEMERRVQEAIHLIGLSGFEDVYPKEISGGMKQRVGLARALACDPQLLFMDEPFSALDPFTAEGLRAELLHIWAQKDRALTSILLVSHDIKEVVYMADRIVVMEAHPGRISCIIENTLPRPRNYRSPEFLNLVDKIHDIYAHKETVEIIPLQEEPISPLLAVGSDEVLGFLEYLHMNNDTQDVYKIGAESREHFDRVIVIAQAAELLNFVEMIHRTVSVTEIGKAYLAASSKERHHIWKEQLLTIPLFIKTCKWLLDAPKKSLSLEDLLSRLGKELPKQDATLQLKMLLRWGRYGGLFAYHKKYRNISLLNGSKLKYLKS